MKQFIQIIITLLLITFTSHAVAEHEKGKQYAFVGQHIPVVCAPGEYVHSWASDHNLTPVSMSFGKAGGVSTGENVYAITYWLDLDNNRTMASVEAPDDALVCIIFYTHELMLNPNLGAKTKVKQPIANYYKGLPILTTNE